MTPSLFSKALGWALLNSLWQFALLWMIFMLVTGLFKKLSSSFKHSFALLMSISGLVWFIAGILSTCFAGIAADTGIFVLFTASSSYHNMYATIQQFAQSYLEYITYFYLIITGVQFTRFFYSFHQSHTFYTAGLSKVQVELRLYVQKMAMHLNITRSVRVFISEYVDTPLVIGFLKPTILVPLACVNQLSVAQLEAILLHELAHIKRNDYLVNIYVAAMEIVFFFNPFSRLILECIKSEREHSCDDRVIQHQFSPHLYASALFTLEQNRIGYVQTGIAATGMSRRILLHRVQRILKVQTADKNNFIRNATCFAVACIFCLLAGTRHAVVTEKLFDYTQYLYSAAGKFSLYKPKAATERLTIFNEPAAAIHKRATEKKLTKTKPVRNRTGADHTLSDIFAVSIPDQIGSIPLTLQTLSTENRNFTIPDEILPELPPVAMAYTFPYVSPSSFYFSTDTLKPRIKLESYHERNARESLLKAKKALNEINWTAIQKSLPAKVNINTLRREIEKSIDRLNWQQIDEEVKDSINRQVTDSYKNVLLDEYEAMKNYRNQQQKLETLQKQLQLQQKNYKNDAENKAIEIQKQLSKYKIVVYL